MRIKFVTTTLLTLAFFSSYSQNEECARDLSIFTEYVKAKNYTDAYTPWKAVYQKCPDMHYVIYAYGERILKDRLKNLSDKQSVINELNALYDSYSKYFPKRMSQAKRDISKALLLIENQPSQTQQIYSLLDSSYKNDKENFSDDFAIYNYFASMVDLYNQGVKQLQDVFYNYDDVNEIIESQNEKLSEQMNVLLPKEENSTLTDKEKRALEVARVRINNLKNISESVDAKLGQLADCENLIPLYQRNLEANKNDIQWLKRAAGRMSDKDCTSNPLFVSIVTNLNNLEPSATTAYYLGVLADSQKKSSEALKYYNQAVDLETNNMKKSNILVRIALKHQGQARVSFAQKALTFNPSNSSAYQVIAGAYASAANDCGKTSFEKRAVYWLAAQMARKGGLENIAKKYEAMAPSKTDVFSAGYKGGETITFKCWISQSVKVPAF